MTSTRKAYFVGEGTQRLDTAGEPLGAEDSTMTGFTTTHTRKA